MHELALALVVFGIVVVSAQVCIQYNLVQAATPLVDAPVIGRVPAQLYAVLDVRRKALPKGVS